MTARLIAWARHRLPELVATAAAVLWAANP
jgi:hypothetical protein